MGRGTVWLVRGKMQWDIWGWVKNRRKRGWEKKPKVRGKSAEISHSGKTRINSGVSGALSPFGGFDTPFLGGTFS